MNQRCNVVIDAVAMTTVPVSVCFLDNEPLY